MFVNQIHESNHLSRFPLLVRCCGDEPETFTAIIITRVSMGASRPHNAEMY